MSGASALNRNQVKGILNSCKNARDKALMSLGFCTGYRISELLRIRISDVATVTNTTIHVFDAVNVRKTKNGTGRAVRLNSTAKKALFDLVKHLLNKGANVNCVLFGRHAVITQAVTRQYANILIKKLAETANIFMAKISSHTMRKTFSKEMFRLLNRDIFKLQHALGHKSINSTIRYIAFDLFEIDNAIEQLDFS